MATDLIVLNQYTDSVSEEDKEENLDDPLVLSKNLSKLMKRLKGENFMDDSSIDYNALVKSDAYQVDYFKMSNQLKKVDLNQLLDTDPDQNDANLLAFFINIYNALTIHAIAYLSNLNEGNVVGGNLLTQLQGKFWAKMAYEIGKNGQVFSLDDIEHGILRGNRPHPSSSHPQFGPTDDRRKLAIKQVDSRIHFALNCGAKSCPPISFYTVENLQRGLDLAAQNFLTNETSVDLETKTIMISKLLLWYREDFILHENESSKTSFVKKALHYVIISKGLPLKWMTSIKKDDQTLIEYIFKYLKDGEEKKKLQDLIEDKNTKEIKIEYKPYDFGINLKNKA